MIYYITLFFVCEFPIIDEESQHKGHIKFHIEDHVPVLVNLLSRMFGSFNRYNGECEFIAKT